MFKTLAAWIVAAVPLVAQPVSLHVFAREGKYGFVDDDGAVRISPQFDGALEFAEGVAAVAQIGGTEVYQGGAAGPDCRIETLRWGYTNTTGQMVIQFRFNDARPFSEGRAAVRVGSKWGFIDLKGQPIGTAQFATADDFHDGMARV